MNIKFKKLILENFKAFREKTVLDFNSYEGLIAVTGVNEVEPRLGANGAGKSSIFDALTFVMFGRTARGVRGQKVISWEPAGQTRVALRFTADGKAYVLTRTVSPNKLTLKSGEEERVVEQEALDTLFGMDFNQFLSSVLMSQFGQYFFDLSSAEKLRVFSEALRLGHWTQRSEKARLKAAEYARAEAALTARVQKLTGSIEAQESALNKLRVDAAEFVKQREEEIKNLKAKIRQFSRLEEENTLEETLAISQLEKTAEATARAQKRAADAEARVREQNKKVATARAEARSISERIAEAEAEAERIAELGPECEECKQSIPHDHKKKAAKRAREAVETLVQAHVSAQDTRKKSEEEQSELEARVKEHVDLLKALEDERKAQERSVQVKKSQARIARIRLSDTEAALKKIEEEENVAEKRVRSAEEEYEKAKEALVEAAVEEKRARKEREAYEFWQRGFRELRLWLIEQALTELQVEVRKNLQELGLEGWKVRFEVERTTSENKTATGFYVFISSPKSEGEVAYEQWSGGETQRLRIAGAAALAALVQRRSGTSTNIEAWDEPTAHMSQEGLDDLCEFFRRRADVQGRQVWLVDHRVLNSGVFNSRIIVRKTREGSRIEEV